MSSKNILFVLFAIIVGCASQEVPQAGRKEPSGETFFGPDPFEKSQLTSEQFLEVINQGELACSNGAASACWFLFTKYRGEVFESEKIHSIKKSDESFQKLCRIASVTCTKDKKVISTSNAKSKEEKTSGSAKYLVKGKYVYFSFVEFFSN